MRSYERYGDFFTTELTDYGFLQGSGFASTSATDASVAPFQALGTLRMNVTIPVFGDRTSAIFRPQ